MMTNDEMTPAQPGVIKGASQGHAPSGAVICHLERESA
jgi:hypothetical protein